MTERWLPCPGYEGLYEVSDLGRMKSLGDRQGRVRILAQGLDSSGYPTVMLTKEGKRGPRTVHRLVALAFNGDKRNILHCEAAHLDGSRTNNRADNLKWVSHTENMSHKFIHGTDHRGSKHPKSKLTEDQAQAIISRLASGESCADIAPDFGVSKWAVESILKGRNWRHLQRPADIRRPRSTGNGQAGTGNHNAKFTDAEVADIRTRRSKGETCQSLADKYGVWKGTISRIARGAAYPPQSAAPRSRPGAATDSRTA